MSTETIIESGFYDSVNGDRKYNAKQMSAIFDGIIKDGVFAVGDAFRTEAFSGNTITVGTGRAWFNSTWMYNDAKVSLTVPTIASASNDAVDLVIIEVDRNSSVRAAKIKFANQHPYSNYYITDTSERRAAAINEAIRSVLVNASDKWQYPIAAIYRPSGFTGNIAQKDITYLVGSENCPYVTGILDTVDVTNLVMQWDAEFRDWFGGIKASLDGDVATWLTSTVNGILNGTTKVGDANKLGGKDASEYATPAHIKTEGQLGASVQANLEAVKDLNKSQVRNIYARTEDMTAGVTALATGAICIVYE